MAIVRYPNLIDNLLSYYITEKRYSRQRTDGVLPMGGLIFELEKIINLCKFYATKTQGLF